MKHDRVVMVFPLPVNAVEHYMLAEDSVEYPRWFSIVVHLRGWLDETRLRDAIEAATKRHPLLRAVIEYNGNRPKQWLECRSPRFPVEWHAESSGRPADYQRVVHPGQLEQHPGLRFHLRRDEEGDVLGVDFHHACTDGLGAVQFIDDLLAVYGIGAGGGETVLPPLDARRLTHRDRCGLTGWRRPLWWLYGSIGWLAAIEFLSHRPAPMGDPADGGAGHGSRPNGYCWRALTHEQSSALIRAAKQEQVTVNDLLIRDVFVALQEFVECHYPARAPNHKRIMVPVSLRVAGDERLPAANVVAMVNLDRRPHRWPDRRRMLRVLHWELAAVKRLRLGLIFVQVLHTLQTLFGSLRPFLPTDRCQATCVVSNLGVVLPTLGADVIRAIEFYPPIRPLTSASFGVATHADRLFVSLRYDATALSADEGAELIDRFLARLQESYGAAIREEEAAAV